MFQLHLAVTLHSSLTTTCLCCWLYCCCWLQKQINESHVAVADLQQMLEQTSAALVSSQAAEKEARAAAGRRRLKDAAAAAAAAVTHGFGVSTAADNGKGSKELQQLKVRHQHRCSLGVFYFSCKLHVHQCCNHC